MKTIATRTTEEELPVLTIELYQDRNNNYFARVMKDRSIRHTATFTEQEEAVVEAVRIS